MSAVDTEFYTKRNKTSRQRGYSFEKDIENYFKTQLNWGARRLGGSSTGLPDVAFTTSMNHGIIVTTEAKEIYNSNNIYIEEKQIKRCYDAIDQLWPMPRNKFICLAFKYMRNIKINPVRKNTIQRYVLIRYEDIFYWLRLEAKDKPYLGYTIYSDRFQNPMSDLAKLKHEVFYSLEELRGYLENI